MRKFAILLCILLVTGLVGCGKAATTPPPAVTLPAAPVETTAVTTEAMEAPTEATELQKEENFPDASIDTAYYYISLYGEWADSCVAEIHQMHSGLPIVTLYEKTSHEAFGGGKLCSIQMMPVSDDTYKDFPSYDLLGVLDAPDGSFHLIALYPTDVQFDADTVDAYHALASKLNDVFCNISPRVGIELAMPAPAA